MCILCEINKWTRTGAAMLPWLVIPMVGSWALSQLLPPAFRLEVTSPRLACLLVLLVTLFWYEVLMPQLSAWRVRRNAKLKERKRFEAIEMEKLRKTATRRCRNCLTAYRDQNPGGGKFMCSYCGHISKRPVLNLPVPPGMGNSGILKNLVGKGGKILNGKAWSDNGWICGQDWLENGNWSYGKKNGGGLFGGNDDHFLSEKSYCRLFVFVYKAFSTFFLCVMWIWGKMFGISSSRDDDSADAERRGILNNGVENGGNCQESRGEKARRKAEEKRQARLEKELLEEEERKQREEVARLVDERRRLRDEKMEAEKEHGKRSPHARERECKKEVEKKRQERKKERERGSSKSNSSAEELEKRPGKESVCNMKNESDKREQNRSTPESMKTHGNHNRGDAGTRYLDRMRGTFLSSSRAFTGGGFFGKSYNTSTFSREQNSNTVMDHAQTSINRKEIVQPHRASEKSILNGDDKSVNSSVLIEPQSCSATPKKSWQQLFTRASVVSASSNSIAISRPTVNHQEEDQNLPFSSHPSSTTQSFDNPIKYGPPSPFSLPSFPFGSSSSTGLSLSSEASFPKIGDSPHQFLPEESEIFEEPCYVPDPMSLLGPVSESFDSFQLDLGFVSNTELKKPRVVKTVGAPSEVTKPSPIESPLSRSRVSEERHSSSFFPPNTTKAQENCNIVNDTGTYQMWNTTSPLGQDVFSIVGGPASWLLSPEMNLPKNKDSIHQVPHKTMASLFKKDEQAISGTHPPQNVVFGNCQNSGTLSTSIPASVDSSQWLPKTLFAPTPSFENHILLKPMEEAAQNGLIYGKPGGGSAANHQFVLSTANSSAKKEWTAQGSRDGVGNSPNSKPSLYGHTHMFR